MDSRLKIVSYNCHGLGPGRYEYIQKLVDGYDFVLIQEHWLIKDKIHDISKNLSNVMVYGVSGMKQNELLSGRPFGGCAIIWKKDIACRITPVHIDSSRCCAVLVTYNEDSFLLTNVLQQIANASITCRSDKCVIGGDYNTDLHRPGSLHTQSLQSFLCEESFVIPTELENNGFIHTFESKIDGSRSVIDHFAVTENMYDNICYYGVLHDGDNLSDHCPVVITISDIHDTVHRQPVNVQDNRSDDKVRWE
jgi:exonuclease III